MKVYHKKNHHKRGIKLLEADMSIEDAVKHIKDTTNILDRCIISRWWERNGDVYMDYGSHSAYLVFKDTTLKEGGMTDESKS